MTPSPGTADLEQIVVPAMAEHPGGLMARVALSAAGHLIHHRVVVAAVTSIDYPQPLRAGQMLRLHAAVTRVGHSTMTVVVTGQSGPPQAMQVLKGVFEIEAVDAAGGSVAIDYQHRKDVNP